MHYAAKKRDADATTTGLIENVDSHLDYDAFLGVDKDCIDFFGLAGKLSEPDA